MGAGLAGITKGCVRLIWGGGWPHGSGFRREKGPPAWRDPAGQGLLNVLMTLPVVLEHCTTSTWAS